MQPTFIVLLLGVLVQVVVLQTHYQKYNLSSQSSELQSLKQWHDSKTPKWRVYCESILSHFGKRRRV